MAIFIANLAFAGAPAVVAQSKLAVLIASLAAGATGYIWLRVTGPLSGDA
jgi:NhaA family Na+:H+ antiporter